MIDDFVKLGDVAASIVSGLRVPAGVKAIPVTDRAAWLERRKPDVTASVAAALFGANAHPYMTSYELWARKSGLVSEPTAESPAMRRGRLLEPVAIEMLREERPSWTVEAAKLYFSETASRVGATPDVFATRPDIAGVGVVQLKTVGNFAFKKGWQNVNGEVEVPLWIVIQTAIEAALTGATWAAIAAMTLGDGGLELHIEDVPIKPALIVKVRELAADFWRRVAESDPYPVDYGRDADLIFKMYRDDDGGSIDLSANERIPDLLILREQMKERENNGADAAKQRRVLDAELIAALGNATRGLLADGRVIEAPTTRKKAHMVADLAYRTVRIKEPRGSARAAAE